jgi:hypothetical protein
MGQGATLHISDLNGTKVDECRSLLVVDRLANARDRTATTRSLTEGEVSAWGAVAVHDHEPWPCAPLARPPWLLAVAWFVVGNSVDPDILWGLWGSARDCTRR